MRPSLIEVYRGDDYEKTLLPRLQKQSVVWVRNIKAQRPNAFADDVFHTIYNMAVIDSREYQKDILV